MIKPSVIVVQNSRITIFDDNNPYIFYRYNINHKITRLLDY